MWSFKELNHKGILRQINTCRKVPLQVKLFWWRHFLMLSISLICLRSTMWLRVDNYKRGHKEAFIDAQGKSELCGCCHISALLRASLESLYRPRHLCCECPSSEFTQLDWSWAETVVPCLRTPIRRKSLLAILKDVSFFLYSTYLRDTCLYTSTLYKYVNRPMNPGPARIVWLKVVGNEKWGGSGRWQMIDIGLGPWWSMSVFLCIWPPSWI